MAALGSGKTAPIGTHKRRRADLAAGELKRLITQRNLKPGDKLPQEIKLQETFGASKGTIREAPRSLEVQGLVSVSMGPAGGGTIVEVPLDRTFQLMQNYLFFKDTGIADIYTARCLLEPELVAGAVSYLTEDDFRALEHTIDLCDPASIRAAAPLGQRQKDLSFHDILAVINPNPMLRFCCELINEMIRQFMVFGNETSPKDHAKFGALNVKFHRQVPDAAHARNADTVRAFISTYMDNCMHHITRMKGRVHGRLVLDSEIPCRHRPLIDDHDDSGHSGHSEDRV